jgi:DNA-binding NarL/FixJ family response regulator
MKAVLAGQRNSTRDAIGRALTLGGWNGPVVDRVVALPARVHASNGTIVVVSDGWPRARPWLEASTDLTVPAVVVNPDRAHDAQIRAAGAHGLLGWPMTSERLEAALRAVAAGFEVHDVDRGRSVWTPDDAGFESRDVASAASEARPRLPPLSPREREILALVAAGASNKRIAAVIDVSPNTVKVHLAHLFAKLGVTTRAEAVATAIARGELAI